MRSGYCEHEQAGYESWEDQTTEDYLLVSLLDGADGRRLQAETGNLATEAEYIIQDEDTGRRPRVDHGVLFRIQGADDATRSHVYRGREEQND